MSDARAQQIKAGIQRALDEVARRFKEDPTPTDGSFRAAQEKMRRKPKPADGSLAGRRPRGG